MTELVVSTRRWFQFGLVPVFLLVTVFALFAATMPEVLKTYREWREDWGTLAGLGRYRNSEIQFRAR